MKTKKELLQLLLEEFKNPTNIFYKDKGYEGLCYTAFTLQVNSIISYDEYIELRKIFEKAAPKFWQRRFYHKDVIKGFYWPKYKKEPRIKWLEEQVKKHTILVPTSII